MPTITIEIPDDVAASLQAEAETNGESVEKIAGERFAKLFLTAAEAQDRRVFALIHDIVEENTELYRRLA